MVKRCTALFKPATPRPLVGTVGEDPVELVIRTIELYLAKKCRDILDYISITSQKRMRISLYALFTLYQSTEQYPRFMDALAEALKREPSLLERIGLRIEGEGEEQFLVADRESIERLCTTQGQAHTKQQG